MMLNKKLRLLKLCYLFFNKGTGKINLNYFFMRNIVSGVQGCIIVTHDKGIISNIF